ncbi:serine/arginine repetitive matrix protein 1-like [Sciurus carolinensis]|uniref:serine/arginine repetitive matrix protein 1-like n=1 Tax=Sciurus carolinensis TaxID=30640 RepID=UPI001FB36274|nr:serine/arginine repetitive matrix protein 1-like [Sciurus carolinensis]
MVPPPPPPPPPISGSAPAAAPARAALLWGEAHPTGRSLSCPGSRNRDRHPPCRRKELSHPLPWRVSVPAPPGATPSLRLRGAQSLEVKAGPSQSWLEVAHSPHPIISPDQRPGHQRRWNASGSLRRPDQRRPRRARRSPSGFRPEGNSDLEEKTWRSHPRASESGPCLSCLYVLYSLL